MILPTRQQKKIVRFLYFSKINALAKDAPPTLQTGNQTLYVVHHLAIDWERFKLSFPSNENGFAQVNYYLEGILNPIL